MPDTQNQLFFVSATTDDGDNMDLLVVGTEKAKAVHAWRKHFELDSSDKPKWVGVVPGVTPTCEPGPIDWSAINPD